MWAMTLSESAKTSLILRGYKTAFSRRFHLSGEDYNKTNCLKYPEISWK